MLDQILNLTKKLMSIRTIADYPKELHNALELVRNELKDNSKLQIEEFESNGIESILVHNTKQGTRQFKIILNAHLDVIHASNKQFVPYEKSGKLYGRGAYDMKATLAVMVLLFNKLVKDLSYPIALQIVTDEEIGGYNGTAYQIKQGLRSDFTITGDSGSGLNIIIEAKGILWLNLQTQGVKAHGAYLWRGKNALWKLHTAIAALHKIFPTPIEETWATTMNLAKIETDNSAFNHVPDSAKAYLDIRFIPEDEKNLMRKIEQAIGTKVEMDVVFKDSPEYIDPNHKYVKQLQKLATKITGEETKLISAHAPSDLRHFNAVNCLGVQFCPKGNNQHADDEWVDIKSIEDYYKILEQFLLSIKK